MKERVTLTIDAGILKQVDSTIDGYKIKNRSHAIELYLLQAMGSNVPKQALILAGGAGTRLQPITHEIPKPLIPIHDKPIIDHTIELLKKHGIRDIIVSIGYKGEKIKEHLGNGKKYGVNITYIEEEKPLGTAGPLRLAKPFLNSTFIMCNADELKNIDLPDMYMFHKEKGGMATIALTTVQDPSIYGVANLKGNLIKEFIEKPETGKSPSNLINAGLYILEPEVIDLIPEGQVSIERDIFPHIATKGRLFGYPFDGQWFDTGTMERYETAIRKWKDIE